MCSAMKSDFSSSHLVQTVEIQVKIDQKKEDLLKVINNDLKNKKSKFRARL